MSAPRLTATAVATVTIEFRLGDSWGNKCSIEQVQDQGADAARGVIREIKQKVKGVRAIGDIRIRTIIVEDAK